MEEAPMVIEVKLLTDTARLPIRCGHFSAGFDLFSDEDVTIEPGTTKIVRTGIAVAFTMGLLKIEGRSGLASQGIFPIGGIIDPSYRGEVGVILHNSAVTPHIVMKGNRIAQLVHYQLHPSYMETAVELAQSGDGRGTKGFGSSGR